MPEQVRWLPTHTAELLREVAAVARARLRDDLQAVVLVGTAMHPERANRARRPEVLLVVRQLTPASLRSLGDALAPFVAKGLRPKTVTARDLERGADVFALEMAEWKVRHWLIDGQDPFSAIQIQRADLRHTIELNLRGLGRRLRNRVLVGIASRGRLGDARRAVSDALDTLCILAHHIVAYSGRQAPLLDVDVVRALRPAVNIETAGVESLLTHVRETGTPSDPLGALEVLLPFVERLTDAVDAMGTDEAVAT